MIGNWFKESLSDNSSKIFILFQFVLGVVLITQSLVLYNISKTVYLPINLTQTSAGSAGTASSVSSLGYGEVSISTLVSGYLLLAGLFHIALLLPWLSVKYQKYISDKINPYRWIEYALTSSLMVVVVAMVSGIYELPILLLLFMFTSIMIFCGWVMEKQNQSLNKPIKWSPFVVGSIIGVLSWVMLALNYLEKRSYNYVISKDLVLPMSAVLLICFASFPINLALYFYQKGAWRSYRFTDNMFSILSLVSKTTMAWVIFVLTML